MFKLCDKILVVMRIFVSLLWNFLMMWLWLVCFICFLIMVYLYSFAFIDACRRLVFLRVWMKMIVWLILLYSGKIFFFKSMFFVFIVFIVMWCCLMMLSESLVVGMKIWLAFGIILVVKFFIVLLNVVLNSNICYVLVFMERCLRIFVLLMWCLFVVIMWFVSSKTRIFMLLYVNWCFCIYCKIFLGVLIIVWLMILLWFVLFYFGFVVDVIVILVYLFIFFITFTFCITSFCVG